MKVFLKQTEALDLLVILRSIPAEKVSEDPKKRYKALTLRRHIIKELEAKNKEWIDKVNKGMEINKKGAEDFEKFKQELLKVNEGLTEEAKQTSLPDYEKTLKEQEELVVKGIVKELEDEGLKGLYYRDLKLTRFLPLNEVNDKEIEVELLEEEGKNQLALVKDLIERVAIEVFPLENEVLVLGEKFGV